MLSVLIPTYNYNAFFLVNEIHQQLKKQAIDFEIICLDDGSKSLINTKNEAINTLTNAQFKALEKNIGRSAIRNLLAKKAKYPWLLFLDADVIPVNNFFISNYTACFTQKNTVFCGGLLYQNKIENKHLLRYKFGKKHEEIQIKTRISNPEKYFFTSNFLIQKEVFAKVVFEEKLLEYGKEDLLFSLSLVANNFKIQHLKNEVYHLGLENNTVFVAKTKKAMENLIFLKKQKLIENSEIPLLNLVVKLNFIKTTYLIGSFYRFFEGLSIKKSSVFFLNCMKVSYLCYLISKNE